MAPEYELQKKVGHKLTKKRKPLRAPSVQYPERLREGDDAQEDVTAAHGRPAQYMNQSVFSMIAAAGSKTDFHARFEGESSDSEEDQEPSAIPPTVEEHSTSIPSQEGEAEQCEAAVAKALSGRQPTKLAERKGPHFLPKLKLRTAKEKNYMSQSVLLPPRQTLSPQKSPKGITPRDAPVLSKMLEAQAEMGTSTLLAERKNHSPKEHGVGGNERASVSLATRLMEIFGFEGPEEVIAGKSGNTISASSSLANRLLEYPCWFLQSVLLQGYMYITQRHICFFGYLPKKSVS